MPVRKTMDPSLSKDSSTISTETNNQKNPSSANKNVLKSVNKHVNGAATSGVKKVRDNNVNRNGTTVAKNRPPKNNNSTSTSTSSVKTQPKPQTPKVKKVVVLAEGEEEVPKLSRRLKIQNKLEKRIKAAEEAGVDGVHGAVGSVGIPTSPTSTSTSVSMTASEAVSVSPNTQQVRPLPQIVMTSDKYNALLDCNLRRDTFFILNDVYTMSQHVNCILLCLLAFNCTPILLISTHVLLLIKCILNFYFLFFFQAQKLDNNSKIGRPPGTGPKGSAPAGPNSGRKWVHRSVEVGASAGAGASESNSDARQSSIVGKLYFNLRHCVPLYTTLFYSTLFNPL